MAQAMSKKSAARAGKASATVTSAIAGQVDQTRFPQDNHSQSIVTSPKANSNAARGTDGKVRRQMSRNLDADVVATPAFRSVADYNKSEIRKTAWHEAGHAVAYMVHGLDFDAVWVRRSETEPTPATGIAFERKIFIDAYKDLGGAVFCEADHVADGSVLVECRMAGLAGERVLRRTKTAGRITQENMFGGCRSDIQKSLEIVRNCNERYGSDIDEVDAVKLGLEMAWETLRYWEPALRELAEALIERGFVTGQEAREMFARHQAEEKAGRQLFATGTSLLPTPPPTCSKLFLAGHPMTLPQICQN